MTLIKGKKVIIYPYGNPEKDPEGVAVLIEKVREADTTESWLVQFDGEHKLVQRLIRKEGQELPDPKPLKLFKRMKGNTVRYYYPQGEQPRKPNEILGLGRSSHSELKYNYKKKRGREARNR